MKKLLLALLLLSPLAMAKPYQKVHVVEESKKGWGKVIYTDIIEYFRGKIDAELIETFSSEQTSYKNFTPIHFNLELKQKAYVYLLSVSQKESCLIYPNLNDLHNYEHSMGSHTIPSNNSYTIQSNASNSTEQFYLITSVRPIYFDRFKQVNIFKCAGRNIGLQKIAQHRTNQFSDVKQVDIFIK